jgi:hypothetical protein
MPTQSKPVASSAAVTDHRIKQSIAQPTRVTIHYLSFPAIKRTVQTPPAWMQVARYIVSTEQSNALWRLLVAFAMAYGSSGPRLLSF